MLFLCVLCDDMAPICACHVAWWWGPPVKSVRAWVPPSWGGTIEECHVTPCRWHGPIWCYHMAHPLSSFVLYSLCFLHSVCTQSCCCLQVVPRVALIKSQPRVIPRVVPRVVSKLYPELYPKLLLYPSCTQSCLFLWIYFNSSTCPKNLKFSLKIPKFMVITLVIFNSNFAPASLCQKFFYQENIFSLLN
jgi:hypothetical protein